MRSSEWPVRVYYEDTDAGGVVYHARYLHFLERARTEVLRELGQFHARLIEEESLLFSIVDLQIRYLKPARLDDLLCVRTSTRLTGGASLAFTQTILRGADELLTAAEVRVACLDARSMKPRRLPESLRGIFA